MGPTTVIPQVPDSSPLEVRPMIRDSYPDTSRDRPSLSASPIFVCTALAGLILFTLWFLGTRAYHFTDLQMAEFYVYFLLGVGVPGIAIWVLMKRRDYPRSEEHTSELQS